MRKQKDIIFREVYEAAIGFARMWGVKEVLEPLPYLDFPYVRDMIMEWAREYTNGEPEDAVAFFQKKSAQEAGCMASKGDAVSKYFSGIR